MRRCGKAVQHSCFWVPLVGSRLGLPKKGIAIRRLFPSTNFVLCHSNIRVFSLICSLLQQPRQCQSIIRMLSLMCSLLLDAASASGPMNNGMDERFFFSFRAWIFFYFGCFFEFWTAILAIRFTIAQQPAAAAPARTGFKVYVYK